ncbi:protein IWS1 homolog isoform X1 [Vanessa cardui]|uniref:protein IWS1 homolog isoform X1 n=1 Tax=Vanessa cardui TaxID=171605 RepID=UPI001F137940|nr:protein IWS1 homolog isoform X1 [Vanessa cardui]
MSDYEEPAAKMSKIEMAPKEHQDELDEGQEEWLSEGILTDDDYNPANEQELTNTSQEDTMASMPDTADASHVGEKVFETDSKGENLEQDLNNLENSNQTEFPGELGAFLIRKTDVKAAESKKAESELDESTKHSDDDGHDTDELLRMLGEDDSKKEMKKSDHKRTQHSQSSDDDDEYIFEGAKVARLKVAKNAIMKKYPTKAVPEEMSDRDGDSDMEANVQEGNLMESDYSAWASATPGGLKSSDEGLTMKRMFGVTKRANVASKSTARPDIHAVKTVTNKMVSLHRSSASDKSKVTSTPISKSTSGPKSKVQRPEPDEIIDEEEFLEDDQFDLDEDLGSSMEGEDEGEGGQRLMRPERMDEDAPSDPDSHSDDDSLYDELPSSDSDDLNEWFTLDVRAERAGDYIPLLGAKAHQLLLAEKQRVSTRLSTLKQSMSTLNESSSQQAEMLRRATLQLAELDAALKA